MGLLVAQLVLGGLFWLLWRFRLRSAASLREWRELAWPAAVLAAFFLVVGLFALAASAHHRHLAAAVAVERFDHLPAGQAEVVVVGRVSQAQAQVKGEWVARVESSLDEGGGTWRELPTLSVDLADRPLEVVAADAAVAGWHSAYDGATETAYLLRGDPLVAVGRLITVVPLTGPDRGVATRSLEASLLVVGDPDGVADGFRRAALWSAAVAATSLVGAVLILVATAAVGVRAWRAARRPAA